MSEQQNLDELRFSRTQSYFDRSLTIRLILGLFFTICLFFFLHFRQTYVETLELGTEAKKYVVAQVDFAFPDEEATIILKQEAGHEIGTIWRIHDDDVHRVTTEFQKTMSQDKESRIEDLAVALSLLTDKLLAMRFTDIRTLQRIEDLPRKDLPIVFDDFFVFIPPPGKETSRLPIKFWNQVRQAEIPSEAAEQIVNYFEKISWEFEVDQGLEYSLRRVIQSRIPEKFTRISAGERLIDKGERVGGRHLAMIQAMKEKLAAKRNLLDAFTLSGSLLLALLFVFVGVIYLQENHSDIFLSNRKLALLTSILLLNLLLAKVTELFLIRSHIGFVDLIRFPLFVPFSAILLGSLMNGRIAVFATIFLAIIFAIGLAVESIPFIVINILTGMIAILSTRAIRRRKEVFFVCGKAWLASVVVILAFNLYESTAFSFSFVSDFSSTFIFMVMTAVLVVGLLPVLESIFQIMTDITLMEFMDPSNDLLRRLTIEAPGTYQHSMVVGNLSEAAASSIGANGLFCRVATQYHDIGKLANPQYFTENQLGGVDMHQLLTPFESSQVIIAHVSEGVALARKVGLPEQFIDVIKEHHGTTLVYYFYHKQIEQVGGDRSQVSERDFRYSGPKPRTKESTIIMIADTLEAASRCLDVFNLETVTELVESLIAQKMEDGQFDESLLTFEELGIVKNVLIKTLLAASHPRIKYPPHHPGEEG